MRALCRLVLFVALAFSTAASAGLFRAYLSSTGNDDNDCTRGSPCRLLPRALDAADDGGEIWILDSANYNNTTIGVTITKSVSILALPGVVGSVVAAGCGAVALAIDAPGIKVMLRNLVMVPFGCGHSGIYFAQGAELHVEDCEISGMGTGIRAFAPGGRITVRNTVLRDNNDGFYASGSVVAVLERVQANNNGTGIYSGNQSQVMVANSVIANNVYGAFANADSGFAQLFVSNSTLSGNQNPLRVYATAGANASIVSDANTIVFASAVPFAFQGAGGVEAIYTYGTNRVGYFNGPVVTPGHALTGLGAI